MIRHAKKKISEFWRVLLSPPVTRIWSKPNWRPLLDTDWKCWRTSQSICWKIFHIFLRARNWWDPIHYTLHIHILYSPKQIIKKNSTRFELQIIFDYTHYICETNNPNSFIEKWPSFSSRLKHMFESQFKSHLFATMWSTEVENLLILLKLFPFKATGRNNVTPSTAFSNAIKKLIVFSEVILKCVSCVLV